MSTAINVPDDLIENCPAWACQEQLVEALIETVLREGVAERESVTDRQTAYAISPLCPS
jgi:hypothetical protein